MAWLQAGSSKTLANRRVVSFIIRTPNNVCPWPPQQKARNKSGFLTINQNADDFLKCFAQFTLGLGLIRGVISLIGKLDRVSKSPRANPDVQGSYDAGADDFGLNGYPAAASGV